ncbi:MAG TPA: hypothetical protein VGA67_02850 [Candidatus Dojkabacteria bacterium]
MELLKVNELNLADVVDLELESYSFATVENITEDDVILKRPYIHTSDFSYTGGVIVYTGMEEVKLLKKYDSRLFKVVLRKELK